MAEEDEKQPQELSLSEQLLAEEEQDVLFKTQMKVANFFLGYWKHMLAVLGVVLLGVLVYSLWAEAVRENQQEVHEKIATTEGSVNTDSWAAPGLGYGHPLPPGEEHPTSAEEFLAIGNSLKAIADESDGVGQTYAQLRAATFWKASGTSEALDLATTALEQSSQAETDGILAWSTQSQLAGIRADAGLVDEAAAIYQSFTSEGDDAITQEALYRLGQLYSDNGRVDDATAIWTDLVTRFPASHRAATVQALLAELSVSG